MGDEIQRLVSVFRTEMAAEQLKLKYSGSFMDFVRNVSRRRTRYSQKLENIRIENEGRSSVIAECRRLRRPDRTNRQGNHRAGQ